METKFTFTLSKEEVENLFTYVKCSLEEIPYTPEGKCKYHCTYCSLKIFSTSNNGCAAAISHFLQNHRDELLRNILVNN